MANRKVVIKGTNVGIDIQKIAIYRDEIDIDNLVAIVPKKVFMEGYEFDDDDAQENYVCQCDDPCKTVVNLSLRQKNYPPTVAISGSTSALVGTSVLLTATGTDPNGDALTYEWNDGATTETNTVTSSTHGDETYSVVATDIIGAWGNDTHTINWFTTTTTTTQAPTPTTPSPTTQPPTPFARINGVTTAQVNTTITLTGEDYNFTGSTWAWTGGAAAGLSTKVINITESSAGSVTYGVTIDGTYTDTHTVVWSTTPPPTTTTTAAPVTTTTTAAPPPTTTTTTCSTCEQYTINNVGTGFQSFSYTHCSTGNTLGVSLSPGSSQTFCSCTYPTQTSGDNNYNIQDNGLCP